MPQEEIWRGQEIYPAGLFAWLDWNKQLTEAAKAHPVYEAAKTGAPMPADFFKWQDEYVEYLKANPTQQSLFVLDAATGEQCYIAPHHFFPTMNGASCPPVVGPDGNLIMFMSYIGTGNIGRFDPEKGRYVDMIITKGSSGDETHGLSAFGDFALVMHCKWDNGCGFTGLVDLKNRTDYHFPGYESHIILWKKWRYADNVMNEHYAGVYALDARTGVLKWRFPTATSIRNSVAVENGRVFATTIEGTVFALNAADGTECWRYRLGPGTDRWVYNSPVVDEGVIYVGTAPVFVALDAAEGRELWRARPMGGGWISSLSSPAVGGELVFAASYWGNGFFAFEKKTGETYWQKKAGFNSFHVTPTYDNGIIYANADGILHAIDVNTNTEEWKHSVNNWVISSPAVSCFSIEEFVVIGAHFGRIQGLERATGKLRWQFQVGKAIFGATPYTRDSNALVGSPVIAGDVVYIGAPDGKFYALDVRTGKELWSYCLGTPIFATPAVSGNTVFISDYDGVFYAFVATQ